MPNTINWLLFITGWAVVFIIAGGILTFIMALFGEPQSVWLWCEIIKLECVNVE